ncbi:MAG: DUF2157 domain-containing protein [Gammaproteobacteria bacterium]|nr:DUF2157 domain-containing protein [Gammaproteobacteria bacterium]
MTLTNQQLLDELERRLQDGDLEHGRVQALLDSLANESSEQKVAAGGAERDTALQAAFSEFSLTRLLYVIGGLLVVLGIIYFMSQLWGDMSAALRILITLGVGLVFAGVGSIFLIQEPEKDLGNVFHAIGGCLVPGGALVTLDELFPSVSTTGPVATTVGLVFLFYLALVIYHRRVVVNFFAFVTGTAFVYLLSDSLMPSVGPDYYSYLTMMIGVSYVLYGVAFTGGWNDRLIPLLYFFGPIGFYGAAYSRVANTQLMELIYPFLAFGGLALSVLVLKSRVALTISTLAVISYVVYLTREYFADSIGWPVALIILGFIVIGLGYLSVNLNRRYL